MYYYILIIIPFISFCLQNTPIKDAKVHWLANSSLFFVLILFVSCFRYGVGTDFFSYYYIFRDNTSIEPLFYELIKFVKSIYNNFSLFIAIVFLLSFGIKLYVFKKISYYKGFFLSIMLFCSFYYIAYEMNAIRAGLAMSLTLLASYYAYIKRPYSYFITCITATLIHYTAFVFLPFYFLLNIKINKKIAIILVLFSAFLSYLGVFSFLINFALEVLGKSLIASRIDFYSTSNDYANNLLFSFSTLRRLFFFLLILFSYDKINAPERLKQVIFYGGFISILIYFLFAEVGYFSGRLSVYYRILECVWLSYFPFIFSNKNTRFLIVVFYFTYSLLQVNSALTMENHNLLPITTIFF